MPRVKPLTRAQAKEEVYRNRTNALAKGLGAAKSFNGMDNGQLGEVLGLGRNTVPKLLKGDNVFMTVTSFWAALDMAGLEVRPKPVKLDL